MNGRAISRALDRTRDPSVREARLRLCRFCDREQLEDRLASVRATIETRARRDATKAALLKLRGKDADRRRRLGQKLDKLAKEIEVFEKRPWPIPPALASFVESFSEPDPLIEELRWRAFWYLHGVSSLRERSHSAAASEAALIEYVKSRDPRGRAHFPSLETLLQAMTRGLAGAPSYEPGNLKRRYASSRKT